MLRLEDPVTGLSILWHFHQPDYRDPSSGQPVLPWVRHHALRGYRDLAVALLESGVPGTINLVPTLLEQLDWYAEGGSDPWLERVRQPPQALSPELRTGLLREGFAGHPAMVAASPGWRRLKARVDSEGCLDDQGLLDLQVWSVLGWTGWSLRRDHPALQGLVRRGEGFTPGDKAMLLAIQQEACATLPDLWARLAEVSASPWAHPILPLVVDARHGRRCLPDLPDVAFAWPGDAAVQLAWGRSAVSERLGRPVSGLWPSEGAVSPEVVDLARAAGFTWLVSDEGVLERSQRQGEGRGPWTLARGLVGFFRDRSLSDLIGFRTAGRDPDEAVGELLAGVARQQGHVTLALDGENPWESHPDAGRGFQERFFQALSRHPRVRATPFAEAAAEPVGRVTRIFTGGWINADFAIWIGDPEDRAAWALLAQTREAVAAAGDPPDALRHVLAAEGSDWFWWYGPEFHSEQADTFDRLFRAHLGAAWAALGVTPPAALSRSLLGAVAPTRDRAPAGPVDPCAPLGWWAAGCWDARRPGGAMAAGVRVLDRLEWGAADRAVHVRLVMDPAAAPQPGACWVLDLAGPGEPLQVRVPHPPEPGAVLEVCLAAPSPGLHRVHVALWEAGGSVRAVGPPGGLEGTVGRAGGCWRGGWV